MITGTAGCTRVKRSRSLDSNMGGDALSCSVRCCMAPRLQRALEHAKTSDHTAAHGLHGAVHVRVGLEDPAHLAAALRRLRRHVEVLDVELGGHAGVLV